MKWNFKFIKKYTQNPKIKMWGGILLLTFIALYLYWLHSKYYPSTDNAYVGAHVIQIAPQVTGPIITLYVNEYDEVKKGQPLFDIDPEPFKAAVDKARAGLDLNKQNVDALKRSVEEMQAIVQERLSQVKLSQAMYDRIQKLVKRGLATLAEGDTVTRDLNVANGALLESKHRLQNVIAQLGDPGQNNAQIRESQAQLEQAKLDLEHTHVVSPANGFIVNLDARVGAMVQRGIVLFSIVDSSQWWVDANFKETDMERIRLNQKAKIVVDLYPSHTFHGIVSKISRGSGAAFSIFPAENATGNWVKVTQRFPVRIMIRDYDSKYPLRIGASSTVTINTL